MVEWEEKEVPLTAKESIRQAFKELLTQHSLDHITVIQICDQANVNRQTFYYHYQNMVHLLEDMIFLEIYDEVNKGKSYDTWKYGFITTLNFIENKACLNKITNAPKNLEIN